MGGLAGAAAIGDVDLWPAELLDPPVGPHPGGVVEGAEPVGQFLDDHDDRELLEGHRDVEPPEPVQGLIGVATGRLALADGPDAPRTVAGAEPGGRIDGDLLALEPDGALPGADLGEPAGVEDGAGAGAHDVVLFLDGVEQAVPGEVEAEAVLVEVTHQSQLAQRFDDLAAIATDAGLQAIVTVERVAAPHRPLLVTASDGGVGVDRAQVRVDAHAGDQEDVAGAVVGVEVAAVIEVAVRRRHVVERQRRLVDRVLVERVRHVSPVGQVQ